MDKKKELTLEEKLVLLRGRDWWHTETIGGKLSEVVVSDGPSGLRKIEDGKTLSATAMPTLSVVANTWNRELARLDAETIADECIEHNVDIILAPGVNIKRTPLNGRNFEYLSEDPYLAGTLGKAFIEGAQAKGVGTSLKHFALNNREYERNFQSSEVDERTMREIYLRPFEIALEANPWTVMCSYNCVNGVYASENGVLLKDILRDEFSFDGVIVSDWGAVHSGYRALRATLDLRMPYAETAVEEIRSGLEKGYVSEKQVDESVDRIIALTEKKTAADKFKKVTMTAEDRHNNAVKIAREGIVLLKNEEDILPLKKTGGKISVVGDFAENPPLGGNGSSFVQTAFKQKCLAEHLKEKTKREIYYRSTFTTNFAFGKKLIAENAYDSDAVILCVGEDLKTVGEGFDRFEIRLSPLQENMIERAASVCDNLIVVVFGGSAIDMSPWIDLVKGVIFAGFAGEGVNEALSEIILGETVPSGKLAETFPLSIEDTPTGRSTGDGFVDAYDEGIFVGYRYYDTYGADVLFPFGHGLSYAEFVYSDLKVKEIGDTKYEISYKIKNVSSVAAKEISEVYVGDPLAMVRRPQKELVAYSKDLIGAGETKEIKLVLDERAFAYYNTSLKRWHVENGYYEISVGASSRDIRLTARIKMIRPEDTQQSFE